MVGKDDRDLKILFASKAVRMFAYGFLSIVLVLYLVSIGLGDLEIGVLLALTLVGDTLISLYLTTHADRFGRRKTLMIGAALMLVAGIVFALTNNFVFLLVAAIIGVISPSGNEVGPFLSIEQSALAQITSAEERTKLFAWYNLMGSVCTALGSLAGGWAVQTMLNMGVSETASYQFVIVSYAVLGVVLGILFVSLSAMVETKVEQKKGLFGLHRSKKVVAKLAMLFSLDAFGGGFVVQSVMAYWFYIQFNVDPGIIGTVFFLANLLSGLSGLLAARLAKRIGLVRTMVYSHIPSNIFLIMVPLMPTFELAMLMLLLRFSISQMDVPTRQAYVVSVVHPDERSAANGITGVARTFGQSAALFFTGMLLGSASTLSWAFIIAGSIKIVYDVLIYFNFRAVAPLENGIK